ELRNILTLSIDSPDFAGCEQSSCTFYDAVMPAQQRRQRGTSVAAIAGMVRSRQRNAFRHISIQSDFTHVARAGLLVDQCAAWLPENGRLAPPARLARHEVLLLTMVLIKTARQ